MKKKCVTITAAYNRELYFSFLIPISSKSLAREYRIGNLDFTFTAFILDILVYVMHCVSLTLYVNCICKIHFLNQTDRLL